MVPDYRPPPMQKMGLGAILSGLAAAGSVVMSCSGRPFFGLVLAIAAIPLGLIGALRSTSSRVSGGPLSLLSIIMGLAGIIIAVVAMVFKIVLF